MLAWEPTPRTRQSQTGEANWMEMRRGRVTGSVASRGNRRHQQVQQAWRHRTPTAFKSSSFTAGNLYSSMKLLYGADTINNGSYRNGLEENTHLGLILTSGNILFRPWLKPFLQSTHKPNSLLASSKLVGPKLADLHLNLHLHTSEHLSLMKDAARTVCTKRNPVFTNISQTKINFLKFTS